MEPSREERQDVVRAGTAAREAGKTMEDNPFRCGWQKRVWLQGWMAGFRINPNTD